MPRIKEEAVARLPCWILGIVLEEFREEYVDEISATHGTARVTALGFLDCCRRKDADVVGSFVH